MQHFRIQTPTVILPWAFYIHFLGHVLEVHLFVFSDINSFDLDHVQKSQLCLFLFYVGDFLRLKLQIFNLPHVAKNIRCKQIKADKRMNHSSLLASFPLALTRQLLFLGNGLSTAIHLTCWSDWWVRDAASVPPVLVSMHLLVQWKYGAREEYFLTAFAHFYSYGIIMWAEKKL